jgi:hypothetical protein
MSAKEKCVSRCLDTSSCSSFIAPSRAGTWGASGGSAG